MSSSFLNRISAASASAAMLIAEAKTAAQLAGERVRGDCATSATMTDIDRPSHSTSSCDVETSDKIAVPPSDSLSDSAATTDILGTFADTRETKVNGSSDDAAEGETFATCSGILVNTPATTTSTIDYMAKFRQIALLAAPAASKMIAGHAQTVANSVAVAAKSAVDNVGARKTAIKSRQEARVRSTFISTFDVLKIALIVYFYSYFFWAIWLSF